MGEAAKAEVGGCSYRGRCTGERQKGEAPHAGLNLLNWRMESGSEVCMCQGADIAYCFEHKRKYVCFEVFAY